MKDARVSRKTCSWAGKALSFDVACTDQSLPLFTANSYSSMPTVGRLFFGPVRGKEASKGFSNWY